MDDSDVKLAEKLRREYPEQFYTLVRMHLSFILDLNTDESDVTPEKNKFKPSKWVAVAFSKKTKCPAKGVMEGAPLTQEGICQVYQLIEFLGKEQNIIQEGIFRRSGKMTRQNELKAIMNRGVPLRLEEGNFSVHDCASVLKNFLAELPEPLLTDAHFPAYYQIADLCKETTSGRGNEKRLLRALQLLLLLLPIENRLLLKDLLQLLHQTACHETRNKMSANNLATLFTPHLICPRKLTPEALHNNSQKMCGVVSFMIKQEKSLFNIPPKLATDIRAYWIEHKSRRTPQVCRVSSDGLTASTVFTFVDRERSAQVQQQVGDPTEVALAQLYAHVQTLPESQHKRRLVKQFNRENGRGTPLRFKPHGRSRSLGDSIKRHIFKTGTKIEKSENSFRQQCSVVRSLSQEDVNTPPRPRHHVKLFQEQGNEGFIPLCEFPSLKKSLCDSNSTVLRLRYSRKAMKPLLLRRRLICVDSENSMCEDTNIVLTKCSHNNVEDNVRDSYKSNSSGGSFPSKQYGCRDSADSEFRASFAGGAELRPQSAAKSLNSLLAGDCYNSLMISGKISVTNAEVPVSNENHSVIGLYHPKAVSFRTENGHSNCSAPQSSFQSVTPVRTPDARNCNTCLNDLDTEYTHPIQGAQSSPVLPSTPMWAASTPALQAISLNQSSSISPITRSTQRMPKAMQETMMTPRSRKPVVVLSGSNLCHLATLNGVKTPHEHKKSRSDEKHTTKVNGNDYSASKLSTPENSGEVDYATTKASIVNNCSTKILLENEGNEISNIYTHSYDYDCCNGSSLTSTFKSYLSSRSVLTASPVDLSFISHESDLDSSMEEHRMLHNDVNKMSESLLFCLNGGQPSSPDVENSSFVVNKMENVEMAASPSIVDVENECTAFCNGPLHETSL